MNDCVVQFGYIDTLGTFTPIVTAHSYHALKFTCHVMHRARALSIKMNNDKVGDQC